MPTLDLEALANNWEPKLRDAFLRAVGDAANRINIADLANLIEQGRVDDALRLVGLEPGDFSRFALVQAQMFHETGIAVASNIPTLRVVFNVRNTFAEQWLRDASSTFVREVTNDQQAGIRYWLQAGLQRGANPRQTALDIVGRLNPVTRVRSGGIIGLNSQQVQWLDNYTRLAASEDPAELRQLLTYGLRDKRFDRSVLKAINDGTGIPADLQAKMKQSYANRALKYRGDNIARTETMRALGQSQTEAYRQAIADGKVDAQYITRFPVTAGDERVRPTHRAVPGMNQNGVAWDEPFKTPFGPQMHAPYPNEINCRCHERIKIDFIQMAVDKRKAA
jgi:hypothetical protein